MITAEKLKLLTTLDAQQLTAAVRASGYKKAQFDTARFLGMTNGEEFVYTVSFEKDDELQSQKIFVRNLSDDLYNASY